MITPSFNITATEHVLPKLALDFTTGNLDTRVTFTRTSSATNPATYVNSSGLITTASNNQPRFDFDPVTLACKGLLIEESRINSLTKSDDFNDVLWIKTRSSISSNTVNSPDGTQNADKLIEDSTANNTHHVRQDVILTAVAYSFSVYLKPAGRTWVRLRNVNVTTASAYFDIQNGVTGTVGSGTTATIQNAGNGWFRCSISFTAAVGANTTSIFLATGDGVDSYSGDGSSGVYIWGGQLEAGAFATSYIPTTTTALTRNADVATMTGTNFSDWYNASEGTLFAQGIRNAATPSVNQTSAQIGEPSGVSGYRIALYEHDGFFSVSNSGTQAQIVSTPPAAGSVFKHIGAYKENNFNAAMNGTLGTLDTSGTVPGANCDRMFIGYRLNQSYLNGTMQKISYWPQRLTDAELQAFSK